jgi:hypothetical protein
MQFERKPSPLLKGWYVCPDVHMRLIIGIEAICEVWTDVSIKTNMLINRVYAAFRGPLRRVKRSRETSVRQIRQEKNKPQSSNSPDSPSLGKLSP